MLVPLNVRIHDELDLIKLKRMENLSTHTWKIKSTFVESFSKKKNLNRGPTQHGAIIAIIVHVRINFTHDMKNLSHIDEAKKKKKMFLTLEKDENHMLTCRIIFFFMEQQKDTQKSTGEGWGKIVELKREGDGRKMEQRKRLILLIKISSIFL